MWGVGKQGSGGLGGVEDGVAWEFRVGQGGVRLPGV